MALDELIGKAVLIVTPALNTPPEKKRMYVIGKVEALSGPMLKLSRAKFTHLDERVWDMSFDELQAKDYMRNVGYNGTCWLCYQSERMRIYPFD